MEIILLEKVARLGAMGDVVTVKDGYARNYLIPQGKALRATNENKSEFEGRKDEIAKQNAERRKDAEAIAKKLEGTVIELVRQASEDGKLYGSVTVRDIGAVLEEKGFEIPRQNLLLERAIKETGAFEVTVMPHPEIEVVLPVRVARNEAEFINWEEDERRAAEEAKAAEEEAAAKVAAAVAAAKAAEERKAAEKAEADSAEKEDGQDAA